MTVTPGTPGTWGTCGCNGVVSLYHIRTDKARDSYVDFNLTKPLSQFLLLLGRDVLVAEEDHTPLRNEKTQFILLLVCEILELQPNNLSSNVPCKRDNFLCCR